jgi:hypothetical protein
MNKLLLLGMLSLAACGGGGGDDQADAGAPDSGGGACPNPLVGADLGDLGALTGASDPGGGDPFLQAALPGTDNALSIELYDGLGVFSGGIATGTYEITGAETQYKDCGACVLIYAGWADTTMEPTAFYMADSGSLTIDNFTTAMTGSIANVHLIHVTINTAGDFTSTPVNDGCESTITSATFDFAFP